MLSAFPCFRESWIRGLTLDKAVHFLIYLPLLFFVSQTGIRLHFLSQNSQRNVSSSPCTPITCPSCPAAVATSGGCGPSGSSTGLQGASVGSLGLLAALCPPHQGSKSDRQKEMTVAIWVKLLLSLSLLVLCCFWPLGVFGGTQEFR